MMPSEPLGGIHYSEFLSQLCKRREAKVYFEIGVQSGLNLSKIEVETAFGIDPDFLLSNDVTIGKNAVHLHRMSSDAFFQSEGAYELRKTSIDLAFLDGMHLFEFLLRDFYNTEAFCKKNSIITMHDCLPFDGEMIERSNNPDGRTPGPYSGAWTGDVWKVIPILKKYRPDLHIVALDCYPTGLVAVSNIDNESSVLKNSYLDIVSEFKKLPNTRGAIEEMYNNISITPASEVLKEFDHSLFFRI